MGSIFQGPKTRTSSMLLLVFAGPVHWTEKKTEIDLTQLQKTGPPVAVAQILNFFSCQLQGLSKNRKTEKKNRKNRLQLVFRPVMC